MRRQVSSFAALLLLLLLHPAHAATTFNFVFDNRGLDEPPPPVPPFFGFGTVTIANDPGDGTFGLTSLGGFSMSYTFGTNLFSDADIATALSEVLVVLTWIPGGQQLQFSNVNAFGSGPQSGSIDFDNSLGDYLTFEPPGFGGLNLYQENDGSGLLAGNYLATAGVPGPIAGAGLPGLVFAAAGLLGWWRRKRKSAAA